MSKEERVLIGRVIGGNVKQKTQSYDSIKKQPAVNDDGTPRMNFYFALAVPKESPELYDREGLLGVFSLMLAASNGRQWPKDLNNDGYSWKCNDGDNLNANGKPYSEYAKGCYIFHFSSGYESLPKLLEPNANGSPMESTNHDNFYTGVHIKVGVSFANNGRTGGTAGIYCNPEFMLLVKHDTVINSAGMSLIEIANIVGHCEQVIGVPYPGVSQVTMAQPAPMAMAQPAPIATMTQPAPMAMAQPAPMATMTQPAPMAMAQPAPMATMTQPAPMAMAQPAPQFTMTPAANGLTRKQYHAAGWTDPQLIDSGMMNAPPHNTILN